MNNDITDGYDTELSKSFTSSLKSVRAKNINRIIFSHININSIRNKFELLANAVTGNVDVLLISETKIDSSFTNAQFTIKGFTPTYRLDRNQYGGGLIFYIKDNIPCKRLTPKSVDIEIEAIFLEANFQNSKWLIGGFYKPPNQNKKYFLNETSKAIEEFSQKYENIIFRSMCVNRI